MTDKRQVPSREALEIAAIQIGCDVAAIRAFARVESRGKAFLPSGHPVILFERHYFHRLTGGAFDASHPELSNERPYPPGGYGTHSAQVSKLETAKGLNTAAAIKSCSWGVFQIMGANWRKCGFISPAHMEKMMWVSADEHLRAFASFVEANPELTEAVRTHDWETAARIYNGPNHAVHQYAPRLAAAYAEESRQ